MRTPDDFQVCGARTIDMVSAVYILFTSIYSPRPADLEIVGVSHGRLEGLTMRRLGRPRQQHSHILCASFSSAPCTWEKLSFTQCSPGSEKCTSEAVHFGRKSITPPTVHLRPPKSVMKQTKGKTLPRLYQTGEGFSLVLPSAHTQG